MSVEDIKQKNPFVWVNRHGSNKRDKEHKMDSQTDTMISKQEVYRIRLKPFVERKVVDSKIYLENFNQEGWIEYLITTMGVMNLEQFITIADDDLKYCGAFSLIDSELSEPIFFRLF
jgi:hypothetical protein